MSKEIVFVVQNACICKPSSALCNFLCHVQRDNTDFIQFQAKTLSQMEDLFWRSQKASESKRHKINGQMFQACQFYFGEFLSPWRGLANDRRLKVFFYTFGDNGTKKLKKIFIYLTT